MSHMLIKMDSWSSLNETRTLPLEVQDEICNKFPAFFEMEEKEKDGELTRQITVKGYNEKHLIDSSEATLLSNYLVQYTVTSFKGTIPYKLDNQAGDIGNLHVHLPNHVLTSFDEVTWIDDACTEKVQELLDKGWRILCVCPPHNARRPDYIFGRNKAMKGNYND